MQGGEAFSFSFSFGFFLFFLFRFFLFGFSFSFPGSFAARAALRVMEIKTAPPDLFQRGDCYSRVMIIPHCKRAVKGFYITFA